MEIRPGTEGKYRLRDYAKTAGWYTPKAEGDVKAGGENPGRIWGRYGSGCVGMQCHVAGWRSPQAHDWQGTEKPERVLARRGTIQRLMVQSQLAGWRSPMVGDSCGIETPEVALARTGGGATAELSGVVRGMERG